MSINENLNLAFDLSFIPQASFPKTQMKSVGILGGGTAGYFAALSLKRCHPELDIHIIESSKIPVIGVGESTTTEILPFLHGFLGFDPVEFFREVKPSLKFGIEFDWGEAGAKPFQFNFFASHHYESYFYENNIENSNWSSVLMNEKKIPVIVDENKRADSFLTSVPFAYHIENRSFVSYLNKKVVAAGIEIHDAEISNVKLDDNGFVSSLSCTDNNDYEFDFYIDCSGFRSKVLGNALKTEFISYESSLCTDRALTFNLPNNKVIDPFTSAITMNNGWCWKIPMREEDHYGYVFSSKFCSEEEALEEVKKKFGEISSHKIIPFKSGRHESAWNKNVFGLGNAYAFIEPLESTAIQTIIQSCMILSRLMPSSLEDQGSIEAINKEIGANWDSFRKFLAVHYKFNNKLDTPFWKHCRENTNLAGAEKIVNLFKERPPLSNGNLGAGAVYTAASDFVFNSYSYDTLLFGQKCIEQNELTQPEMSEEEYFARVQSYKDLSKSAISLYQLFQNPDFELGQIVPDLFSDQDSWIWETEV